MTHEDLFKIELVVSEAFKKSGMDSEELDLALYIFSNLRSTTVQSGVMISADCGGVVTSDSPAGPVDFV